MESAEAETLVNGNHPAKDQPLAAADAAATSTTTTHEQLDANNASDHTAASSVTLNDASPHVIPPYFNGGRLARTDSATPATHGIDLVDQSDEDHEIGRVCWASGVSVDDYVVVSGPTGIGAYVVWNCTVETFKGGSITLRKRFVAYTKTPCRHIKLTRCQILRIRHP
jgi:hypothetical protein